jgi:hypothetical protein
MGKQVGRGISDERIKELQLVMEDDASDDVADDVWEALAELLRLRQANEKLVAALEEINNHLRDVVETHRNHDTNNWTGYYLPLFADLSKRYSAILAEAHQ